MSFDLSSEENLTRRKVLTIGGTVICGTAGCTTTETGGSSGPNDIPEPTPSKPKQSTPKRTPRKTPIKEPDADEVTQQKAIDFLKSKNIDVMYFQRLTSYDGWGLGYRTNETTQTGLIREMGVIGGTWAAFVDTINNPGVGLGVGMYDSDDNLIAEYSILTSWARDYLSGEIDGHGYASLILQTLKVNS